jgi:hypothetical protein
METRALTEKILPDQLENRATPSSEDQFDESERFSGRDWKKLEVEERKGEGLKNSLSSEYGTVILKDSLGDFDGKTEEIWSKLNEELNDERLNEFGMGKE